MIAASKVSKNQKSALRRWFDALKPGDRVRVLMPWSDGKTPGGHIAVGRVLKQPVNTQLRQIRYRTANGTRLTECLGLHDSYHTLMPMDADVVVGARSVRLVRRSCGLKGSPGFVPARQLQAA